MPYKGSNAEYLQSMSLYDLLCMREEMIMDKRPKVMYESLVRQFGTDRDPEICASMCYAAVNMLKFTADKAGITFKELLEKIMEEET